MDKVILIGYFGEVAELCNLCGFEIVGVVDKVKPKGIDCFLGTDEQFADSYEKYVDIPLVITPDCPDIRNKLYERYKKLGFKMRTLISPYAVVSKTANIAEGCIIQSFCNISAECEIGVCVRLNTGANVMHNVFVGDFSTVAPAAVLLGYTSIGSKVYVGANSTILPRLSIGEGAIVGAGAVVTKNVLKDMTVVGVPAKMIVKTET